MPLAELNTMSTELERVLTQLGTPGVWCQALKPNATNKVTVGMRTVGWQDTELVNAYGINARILTVSVKEVSLLAKFDRIEIGNEKYTLDDAIPVYVNGQIVFWKGVVKGR